MILEKEVFITVNVANIKHYESLSYNIPKRLNKKGQLIYDLGSQILVKVDDLSKGSNVLLTKICDICGIHIHNQMYMSILANRKNSDGIDRCKDCGRKKAINSIKANSNNVPYEKSLEYFAIKNNKEYLLSEFSSDNNKKPKEIFKCTDKIYLWNCPDCNSKYLMKVCQRTNGNQNCPYCRGMRVNETNCLWKVHPEVANLLTIPEMGYKFSSNSGKKIEFTCPDCGNIEKKIISNVVANGFSCSLCSDNISYPEKFMISILNQIQIVYKREIIFNWSKNILHENEKLRGNKRYDFYIPSLNCIIETHGEQHYKQSFNNLSERNKSINEQRENDLIKEKLAKENGISNYIVIDCRISDPTFIKNNIISSELEKLVDLTNINWKDCDAWANKSFIKIISDVWNEGNHNVSDIGKLLNITRGTVYRFLIKGAKLGWCDYIPEQGGHNKKAVVQLNLEGNFIREWESARKAALELNINLSGVTDTCTGKIKTSGGFRWIYLESYNQMLIK